MGDWKAETQKGGQVVQDAFPEYLDWRAERSDGNTVIWGVETAM